MFSIFSFSIIAAFIKSILMKDGLTIALFGIEFILFSSLYFIGEKKSTSELAAIIEEASASLEEMNATVETLTTDSEKIADSIKQTANNVRLILGDNIVHSFLVMR